MEALIALSILLGVVIIGLVVKLVKTQDERDTQITIQYRKGWETGFQQGREAEKAERLAKKQQVTMLKKQLEQLSKEISNG